MEIGRVAIEKVSMPLDVESQSFVLFDSAEWLIGIPRSPWAARWWGQHTDWCTAADLGAFWEYRDKGPLVVFRCLTSGMRWQFHPATGEFRDGRNKQVSWRGFVCRNPVVLDAIAGVFGRMGRGG